MASRNILLHCLHELLRDQGFSEVSPLAPGEVAPEITALTECISVSLLDQESHTSIALHKLL